MKELVETEIRVGCIWCQRHWVVFLGVPSSPTDRPSSVVLCPECDEPVLELLRDRVIARGRVEERGTELVWILSSLGWPSKTGH